MQNISTSITFKYVNAGAKEPGPSREFVNQNIIIPNDAHVPRVGEAVELMHWDNRRDMKFGVYIVLFAHTRIALFDSNDRPSGWHTTLTVGPIPDDIDERFITPGS